MREKQRTKDKIHDLFRAVNLCWLSVKHAGRKILAEHDYDMTLEQLMVLFILDIQDGLNLRVIADRADRERTTMTRMIDGLERRGLVVRVPDKSDGRSRLVYLTRLGRRMVEELEKHSTQLERMAYVGLTQDQLAQTSKVLLQIGTNLGYEE